MSTLAPQLPADPLCPCGQINAASPHKGQALRYSQCCGPLHAGQAAPDAQRLMRSRYSAFVRGHSAYLLATWHASTRPPDCTPDPRAQWLGLEIKSHLTPGPAQAEVTFVARYRLAGRAVRQHERSRFVCEGGRWFYTDGDAL